jgi:hypothetical protein
LVKDFPQYGVTGSDELGIGNAAERQEENQQG